MSGKRVVRKSKKALIIICVIAVLLLGAVIGGLFIRRACSTTYMHGIKSVEDFCAMESGKSYSLKCDIDLDGATWTPVRVTNFDGGGHTVKNVNVNSLCNINDSYYSGIFACVKRLSNTNFENISVMVPNATQKNSVDIGIVCGASYFVENVHLKDCLLRVNTSSDANRKFGGISGEGSIFTNCSNDYCHIRIVGQYSQKNVRMFLGGIVGYGYNLYSDGNTLHTGINMDMDSCKVTGCEIYCEPLTAATVGLVAGMVASTNNNAKMAGLLAVGNNLDVADLDNTGWTYTGGLIGYISGVDSALENSASIDNIITCKMNKNFCVGSLVGENYGLVKNSLSDGNTVNITADGNSEISGAYTAGLCAANYGTVSRCVAQNCTVSGYDLQSYPKNGGTAGLIALCPGSVSYCGVWNNTLGGDNAVGFVDAAKNLFHCLEEPNEEQWADVVRTLQLDEELWKFGDGLVLKFTEE